MHAGPARRPGTYVEMPATSSLYGILSIAGCFAHTADLKELSPRAPGFGPGAATRLAFTASHRVQ
ncbi:hypothetical protein GCM10010284_67220 [Streptomyces rubiginosohelvolus]|nr:hypothetical protein GCM10010284_67220 [Streptomyces rubiginosohelvolus]